MLGTPVVPHCPHNESPYDPVVRIFGVLLYPLLDLLDRLGHLSLLEQCERPVSVTIMVLGVPHLGRSAHIDGLLVELVHVVYESKVVVGVWVQSVQVGALLQVVHGLVVLLVLEVGQTQVVLQLGVVGIDLLGLGEGADGSIELALLVETDALVEETLERLAGRDLQVLEGEVVERLPVFLGYETLTLLLKVSLLLLFPQFLSEFIFFVECIFLFGRAPGPPKYIGPGLSPRRQTSARRLPRISIILLLLLLLLHHLLASHRLLMLQGMQVRLPLFEQLLYRVLHPLVLAQPPRITCILLLAQPQVLPDRVHQGLLQVLLAL